MKRVFLGIALATAVLGGRPVSACPSCERGMLGRFNVGVLRDRYSDDSYLPGAPPVALPAEKSPAKAASPPGNRGQADSSKPAEKAKSSPPRAAKKPIKEP